MGGSPSITGQMILGSRAALPQRGPNPLGPSTKQPPLYDPT